MKKLLAAIILCALLLPANAFAVEGCPVGTLPEAYDVHNTLMRAWGPNYENAPADVGGAYWHAASNRMCVQLVNGGTEATRQAVIAMAGNADWIRLESCKYSRAELKTVQDAIAEEMKTHNGVASLGIDGMKNRVTVGILKEALEQLGQAYKARYGDMVHVEEGQYAIPKTDRGKSGPDIPKTGGAPGTPWLLTLALCGLCLGLRKRAGSR